MYYMMTVLFLVKPSSTTLSRKHGYENKSCINRFCEIVVLLLTREDFANQNHVFFLSGNSQVYPRPSDRRLRESDLSSDVIRSIDSVLRQVSVLVLLCQ
jgi:hypothetical protein